MFRIFLTENQPLCNLERQGTLRLFVLFYLSFCNDLNLFRHDFNLLLFQIFKTVFITAQAASLAATLASSKIFEFFFVSFDHLVHALIIQLVRLHPNCLQELLLGTELIVLRGADFIVEGRQQVADVEDVATHQFL